MSIELTLIHLLQTALSGPFGIWVSIVCAQWLIFLFLPIIFWLAFRPPTPHRLRGWALIARTALVTGIGLLASLLLGEVIARPRPFRVSPHIHLLVHPPSSLYAFPSSHATVAFAVATVLAMTFPGQRMRWFVLATLVGLGRIAVGVHYPSDVLAGMALGMFAAWAVKIELKKR